MKTYEAVVKVKYFDQSDISHINFSEEDLDIITLHTNLQEESICHDEVIQFWNEMLGEFLDEQDIETVPDTLYSTIFKVNFYYYEDYFGEFECVRVYDNLGHEIIADYDTEKDEWIYR